MVLRALRLPQHRKLGKGFPAVRYVIWLNRQPNTGIGNAWRRLAAVSGLCPQRIISKPVLSVVRSAPERIFASRKGRPSPDSGGR